MSILKVTQSSYAEVVKASGDKPVLVKFTATWCAPCKAMEPVLNKFALNNPEVTVFEVDIDDEPELTKSFGVRGVPTVVAVKNGVQGKRHVGLTGEAKLLELLK